MSTVALYFWEWLSAGFAKTKGLKGLEIYGRRQGWGTGRIPRAVTFLCGKSGVMALLTRESSRCLLQRREAPDPPIGMADDVRGDQSE